MRAPSAFLSIVLLGLSTPDLGAALPAVRASDPGAAGQAPPAPKTDGAAQGAGAAKDGPAAQPVDDEPRGLRVDAEGAAGGYTLLAPLNSKSMYLVDRKGDVVHTWNTAYTPGGATRFLANGHILRHAQLEKVPRFHGGGVGGRIEEIDWDANVVWSYELATDERVLHHDVEPMPNGHVLLIAWEYHSPDEVRAHGRRPAYVHAEGLWSDVVFEVAPKLPTGGDIVWTWRTWDHLVQDVDAQFPDFGAPIDHPGRIDLNADNRFLPPKESDEDRKKREQLAREMRAMGYAGGGDDDAPPPPKKDDHSEVEADWLHTNAVSYLPEHDLIALSTPHLCEIWVIDHSTTTAEAKGETGGRWKHGGALLYRWGQSRNYGLGGAESKQLFYQHNVTWQPRSIAANGAGKDELRVLLFDNGTRRPEKEFSRVEELVLPFDRERGFVREPGRAFGPAAPAWTYSDPEHFFSPFISGAERLPNGNTLVCQGKQGRVFEVTADGRVVWDYWSPLGGEVPAKEHGGKAPPHALFRAQHLAKDHPGLAGRF